MNSDMYTWLVEIIGLTAPQKKNPKPNTQATTGKRPYIAIVSY